MIQLLASEVSAIGMTETIEDLREGSSGPIVKETVALTDAVQGGRVELLDARFVMKTDVVFVGRSEQRLAVTFVAT